MTIEQEVANRRTELSRGMSHDYSHLGMHAMTSRVLGLERGVFRM